MKKTRISLFITTLMLLFLSFGAKAGFILKKQPLPAVTTAANETEPKSATKAIKEHRHNRYQAIKSALQHDGGEQDNKHHAINSGWEGITALCTGIVGIFFPPLLIAAVVFGALGIGNGKKHRGMAIAGLILGLVGVFFWAFMLAVLL